VNDMDDEMHAYFLDAHQVAVALTEAAVRHDSAAMHALMKHSNEGELELLATALAVLLHFALDMGHECGGPEPMQFLQAIR
jgi:hypothetical protein